MELQDSRIKFKRGINLVPKLLFSTESYFANHPISLRARDYFRFNSKNTIVHRVREQQKGSNKNFVGNRIRVIFLPVDTEFYIKYTKCLT